MSEIPHRISGIAVIVAIHLVLVLCLLMARRQVVRLDHAVDRALFEKLSEKAEDICYVLLQGGSSHTIAVAGAVVGLWLLVRRRWKRLVAWAMAIGGCVVLDHLLKNLFRRPRPLNMEGWPGWSFPSGHVMAVTAVFGMLAYLVSLEPWGVRWKRALSAATGTLVVVTAVALLLPGYHFLSDLLAGYFVGVAWLAVCVAGLRRWEARWS
jgi:membrane-associated phospholipid phosphatase